MNRSPWICCQIGAREHYAIPRALHQTGQLAQLITDAWVYPQSLLNRLPVQLGQNLRERWHPDLAQATVRGFTGELIQFELTQKLKKQQGWDRMIARNQWFQRQAIRHLERSHDLTDPVLFTYSYAALELLQYAKRRGWRTVLGQIDPGICEEKIVQAEVAKHPDLAPHWQPVPSAYWETWQQECQLADRILVNSAWSKQLLAQAGVEPAKLEIVPLVYEPPQTQSFTRTYPTAFSQARPLRILFLGQVNLRKGVAAVLEAITLLKGEPIEFWMVGPQQIMVPPEFVDHPQVRWIGSVARSQVQDYYQRADVFLFPTLSDGFGLTQLEAQAWKLPLIVSRFCGQVVEESTGIVLSQITPEAIAQSLLLCMQAPQKLKSFSDSIGLDSRFVVSNLQQHLLQVSQTA
jgi:glycosyltransferase involved in cell wall biosynthesis